MRSIAWLSEKGGTGKTTSALNTASALAKLGRRVLVVDCDPQGNASLVLLRGEPADVPTLGAVLLGEAEAVDAIRATHWPGVDLLPADVSLADAGLALAEMMGRERRLRLALKGVGQGYDYVILDTSPTRSLLTINVLNYAAEVVVPVDPGLFSLAGLGQLQQAVDQVRRYLDNRVLRISGVVLTRTAPNNVSREIEAQVRAAFGALALTSTIPASTKIEEAHSRFLSVLDYSPRSVGAKAYAALAGEIDHGRGEAHGLGDVANGADPTDHAAA